MENIRQVGGGQTMEGFEESQEKFEINAVADGEPVKRCEDQGDMISLLSTGEKSGG